MAETRKARERRLASGFFDKYIIGKKVIDIGVGSVDTHDGADPIYPFNMEEEVFWDPDNMCPYMLKDQTIVYLHDKPVCDAHTMNVFQDREFDTVYASHVLEHMIDPIQALRSWLRILKPGGHLIISVPHRDLYERKKTLPSKWNEDHKFFILPVESYPPHTFSLKNIIQTAFVGIAGNIEPIEVKSFDVFDTSTNHDKPEEHANGEFSIEVVIKKLV